MQNSLPDVKDVKRIKILLVDLLYSDGGSLGEDVRSITQVLSADHDVEYVCFDACDGYSSLFGVYRKALTLRYDKVVFLSSKVSQLFILAPLRLTARCYAIYHFIPRHRASFHKQALKWLSRFFVIGVYAAGVAVELERTLGYSPQLVPSRIVDRARSLARLQEKLAHKQIRVLVPGVRPGVRKQINLAPIVETLTRKLGFEVEGIYIQSGELPADSRHDLVRKVGKLPQPEYDTLFDSALIVAVEFHEDYEVRASGVILDALRSGSIVVSHDHPIVREYRFPDAIVTDLDHLGQVLGSIRNSTDALGMIPGTGFEEVRARWNSFLR